MSILEAVRTEYPGQSAWERFVLTNSEADNGDFTVSSVDRDMLLVMLNKVGNLDQAQHWFQKLIPALDGRSAEDVISNVPEGREIVRTVLMRMP